MQKWADLCEFKTSMVYKVGSRTARATDGDSDRRLGMKLLLWPNVARGPGISLLLELGGMVETPLAQPELATGISSPLSACQGLKA